jgi:hypothetical protein
VWSLVLLSLALTATTFFPGLSTATIGAGLAGGAAIGIVGGTAMIISSRRHGDPRDAEATARAERHAVRQQDRAKWQTPNLAALARPIMSPIRRAGLFTLRGYLVLAVVFVIIKIVEIGVS